MSDDKLTVNELGLTPLNDEEARIWKALPYLGMGDTSECLPRYFDYFAEQLKLNEPWIIPQSFILAIAHTLSGARVRNARLARQRDDALAENARLRAALEKFADAKDWSIIFLESGLRYEACFKFRGDVKTDPWQIAQEALKRREGDDA